jgi:oxygen-dependent protoporphyrinogen oxidase
MSKYRYDSVIIGAGLTGLTIAYYLRKAGMRVLVLERNYRPGGVIQSHSEEGFVYESGPNTGVITSVELVRLAEELGVSFEVPRGPSRARWIWKKDSWKALPSGLGAAVRTPLFSWKDKFRILTEPFRSRGNNPDETLEELVLRRMGRSFLDYAIDPFISGIYAGDPSQLVTRYALPKLYALEQNHGSFIKGSVAKARQPKTADERKVNKQVFSVKGGLSHLIDTLVNAIGADAVLCNCGDVRVSEPQQGLFTIQLNKCNEHPATLELAVKEFDTVITSRSVVTTTGGTSLVNVLPFVGKDEAARLNSLRYAKVVQVAVGYKHWKGIPVEAFGGLVPSLEKKDILGILFPSALFEGRAPKNGVLLSVFMGGIKRPDIYDMSDEELKTVALKHISEMMETSQPADLLKLFRYPHAIPQYDATSGDRLATIRLLEERYPGLVLAGNIRDGIGMSDRVKQGTTVAAGLVKYLLENQTTKV